MVNAPGVGRELERRWSRRRVLVGVLATGGAAALAACGGAAAEPRAVTTEAESPTAKPTEATQAPSAPTTEATPSGGVSGEGARERPTAGRQAGSSGPTTFPGGDVRVAPDFTFTAYQGADVLGGSEILFSQILAAGKPVVLNFWATLCPPCRVEMPGFQRVHERVGERVTLLGVDIGPFVRLGTREEAQALIQELGLTYPLGTTYDPNVLRDFRVLGVPSTLFITPAGEIVWQWNGVLTEQSLLDLIGELEDASKA